MVSTLGRLTWCVSSSTSTSLGWRFMKSSRRMAARPMKLRLPGGQGACFAERVSGCESHAWFDRESMRWTT
jgi:hypothetical protein